MEVCPLRPSLKNPRYWDPERTPRSEWNRIRKKVLLRDRFVCRFCGHHAEKHMHAHHLGSGNDNSLKNLVTCCVACHAVLHFGRSLALGVIEIWEAPISQVEIVRLTRGGVRKGRSLQQIRKGMKLKKGPLAPDAIEYANEIIKPNSKRFTFSLPEPLCAVFVNLSRWQIAE